jgi:hypothetical protein
MDSYLGQLVVLRTRWNINSGDIGIVVSKEDFPDDRLVVMWTTSDGIKLKVHIQDALLPVTNITIDKIKERI